MHEDSLALERYILYNVEIEHHISHWHYTATIFLNA